jgi:Flp pilus assembly protein CpaB
MHLNRYSWPAILLLLSACCGALAEDPTPTPTVTSTPPEPTVRTTVPVTIDTTPEIARQLQVGGLVQVILRSDWPVPYTSKLIDRCSVASIGPIAAEGSVEVELNLTLSQAKRAQAIGSHYGSKLDPFVKLIPITASDVVSASPESLASSPADPCPWGLTVHEARLTGAGWHAMQEKSGATATQELSGGEMMLALPNDKLESFLRELKSLEGESLSQRAVAIEGCERFETLSERQPPQSGGQVLGSYILAAQQEFSVASLRRPSLGVRVWPAEDDVAILETMIQRFGDAPESDRFLSAQGPALKALVPVTAADAIVIALPERGDAAGEPMWTVCTLQAAPLTAGDPDDLVLSHPGANPPSRRSVAVGKLTSFERQKPVKRFSIDDPVRIGIVQTTGTAFEVIGNSPGRATLQVVDVDGVEDVILVDVLPAAKEAAPTTSPLLEPQAIVGGVHRVEAVQGKLRLVVGARLSLRSEARIQAVEGFRDDLIEIAAESPQAIAVKGIAPGSTTMTVTDEQDKVHNVAIEVISTYQVDLSELLTRLYPDLQIEVIQIKDSMLLRGKVPDEQTREEMIKIAEIYATSVLDQLRLIDPPAATSSAGRGPTLLIPKGMRVLTVTVDSTGTQPATLKPGDRVDVMVTYTAHQANGRLITKTKTMLEYVEIFSANPRTGDNAASEKLMVGLLLSPEEVPYVKLAESKGKLGLAWRRQDDDEAPSRKPIEESLLDELRGMDASPPLYPAPVPTPLQNSDSGRWPSPRTPDPPAVKQPAAASLQDDIRALHDDVKKLIELLEQRQAAAGQATPRPAAIFDPPLPVTLPDKGEHLLSFEADWCVPVQTMHSRLKEFELSGVADGVIRINVDQQRELARRFKVDSLPTYVFYKDGQEIDRKVGMMSQTELRRFVGHPLEDAVVPFAELGMSVRPATGEECAEELKDSVCRGGLCISDVTKAGPADRAGIRSGDILVGLHVWETVDVNHLRFVLSKLPSVALPQTKFYVVRGGETFFGHFTQDLSSDEFRAIESLPPPQLERVR